MLQTSLTNQIAQMSFQLETLCARLRRAGLDATLPVSHQTSAQDTSALAALVAMTENYWPSTASASRDAQSASHTSGGEQQRMLIVCNSMAGSSMTQQQSATDSTTQATRPYQAGGGMVCTHTHRLCRLADVDRQSPAQLITTHQHNHIHTSYAHVHCYCNLCTRTSIHVRHLYSE
jgi:hypothetical protein